MAEHTPIPWSVQGTAGKMYGKEFTITTPDGPAFIGDQLKPTGISIGQAQANAEFAVLAVNSHEALLAMLTEFTEHYSGNKQSQLGNGFAYQWCNRARAAIDLATAK